MIVDKMFELMPRYRNLLELVQDEEIPREAVETALDEVKGEIAEKSEQYIAVIKRTKLDIKAIDEEIKRLTRIKKSCEAKESFLEDVLMQAMDELGINEVGNTGRKAKIVRNGGKAKVVIDNIEAIPARFQTVVTTTEINNDALREAMTELEPLMIGNVQVAHLERGRHLKI